MNMPPRRQPVAVATPQPKPIARGQMPREMKTAARIPTPEELGIKVSGTRVPTPEELGIRLDTK